MANDDQGDLTSGLSDPGSSEVGERDSESAPHETSASNRSKPLLITAGILGGLLVLYLVGVLVTMSGVPTGTQVAGVDIGGQSVNEATQTLEDNLAERAATPIVLSARDQETVLEPASAEMSMDYRATAERASGPIWNPLQLIQHFTGGTVVVPPVVLVNQDLLSEQIQAFAITADEPPTEPTITFEELNPVVTNGAEGEGLDQEASKDLILSSYIVAEPALSLPVTNLQPTVSEEEAQRVRDEYAVPAVSAPVEVVVDSARDSLAEPVIAETLSFAPVEGTLQPQLNPDLVRANLPGLASVEQPGQNATWDVSSGTPVVVPSSTGLGVPNEELTGRIIDVLPKTDPAQRVAQMQLLPTEPELTTEQAQALNITTKLSEFTQGFPFNESRRTNVGQAARFMNGTVLLPGDVFSMNETIKERTEANGYVAGIFISGGRFEMGLGGGVSIATTATWTAAFYAGLEAIEVHPHSLYISRYQPGLEATVAWGLLDLRFRNDTGNGVLITTQAGNDFITVTMWGTPVYDRIRSESSERFNIVPFRRVFDTSSSCRGQAGVDGFTINVFRIFEKGGQEVRREKFTTRYDPTNNVVCGPDPSTARPSPGPTPPPAPATPAPPPPDPAAPSVPEPEALGVGPPSRS